MPLSIRPIYRLWDILSIWPGHCFNITEQREHIPHAVSVGKHSRRRELFVPVLHLEEIANLLRSVADRVRGRSEVIGDIMHGDMGRKRCVEEEIDRAESVYNPSC